MANTIHGIDITRLHNSTQNDQLRNITNQIQSFQNKSIKTEITENNRQIIIKCDSCTFSTPDPRGLRMHKQGAHGEKVENPNFIPPEFHQCRNCDNFYLTRQELNSHVETVHKFMCLKCNLRFDTIEILQNHALTVHQENLILLANCNLCNQGNLFKSIDTYSGVAQKAVTLLWKYFFIFFNFHIF